MKTVRHPREPKEPKGRYNSGFRNVLRFDWYLVIRASEVDFAVHVYHGPVELGCKVLNVRDRIPVRYGASVEGAIVTAGAPVPWCLLYWHHVQGGCPGAGGGTYYPLFEHVVKFSSGYLELLWGQPACPGSNRGTFDLYVV